MTPTRAHLLLAIGLFAHPPAIMTCPGSHPASPRGRTECVPPRKPPSASSPGLPRKAISPPPRPPRRGGLRTPATTELASPEHVPIWPPGIRLPPMIMLYPGSHPAGIHGRGDRAPPRKPPPRHSRAFPVRPFHLRLALRGGAGSVRPQRRNWPRRSMSPFGHQVFVCLR